MAYHPFRNFGLKVVALGLGTLLWFTVSGQADRTVTGAGGIPQQVGALEIIDQTELVDIHVRGLDSQLRRRSHATSKRASTGGARGPADTVLHDQVRRRLMKSRRWIPGP
jgi:hypothetical protein